MKEPTTFQQRRHILGILAGAGVGNLVFQRALAAQVAEQGRVTTEMVQQAEWISGLELTDEARAITANSLNSSVANFERMRAVELTWDVPPALHFHPEIGGDATARAPGDVRVTLSARTVARPSEPEALAALPLVDLAELLRTRQVSSVDLTRLYLNRLRTYDPKLHCVVSLTESLALGQAEQADLEIQRGEIRGPLHGIPWGAKDLIAYPGYKTTWGATPFQDQTLDVKATVAERLDRAGAVLVAKLALGAIAQGDKWFGGMTRNPWNLSQGSSGSSAGSASATSAALVGFSLGSETLGSIISPCRRCGVTGLRPTFGRVSRHGCMPLAWSMDKIGPICRSVEDCAVVFGAICGPDGHDATVVDRPFQWPCPRPLNSLRVGYFEAEERDSVLEVLGSLGVQLVPISLPDELPVWAMTMILNTEAASAFDQLTRQNVTEGLNRWPDAWRQAQFTPAVEYLRANRLRTLLIQQMQELMDTVDLYVGGDDLAITNLTGHPCVIVPNGLRDDTQVKTPDSLTFTGRLYDESALLAVAHAYQQATGHHLARPTLNNDDDTDNDAR